LRFGAASGTLTVLTGKPLLCFSPLRRHFPICQKGILRRFYPEQVALISKQIAFATKKGGD
ncbi:MAG: hypothetical protein RSD46_06745, partial [Oscillospiraceae bacterium]